MESERGITYGVVKPGEEGPVLFVRGGDLVDGRILIAELRTISEPVSHAYRRTLLRGGELLMSLVGNPGEVAIAPPELAGANIARQVGLIALRRDTDSRFVKYYLMSPLGRAQLFTRTQGAVQQVINLSDVRTLSVPKLPQSVQVRIADSLEAYDSLIANNRRRMALLEQAARLLYEDWFVRLRFPGHESVPVVDGVPEGWRRARLGDVADLHYGRALRADNRLDGDVPVFGSSGVVGTHAESLVVGPGIIVGRKGNVGSVFWTESAFFPIDTVYFVEPDHVSPYLHFALQGIGFTSTDVAVPGLNRDFARSRLLFVPAPSALTAFNETVRPMLVQIDCLERYNKKLREARDLLLPRLMSGELTV